jgi:hypothetical protein
MLAPGQKQIWALPGSGPGLAGRRMGAQLGDARGDSASVTEAQQRRKGQEG